ncbi:MAG: hypothetical protein JNM94_09105 [Phycisphaerae bacterium]|nr:hypothetical protein [Phycisphaerae bacterium]
MTALFVTLSTVLVGSRVDGAIAQPEALGCGKRILFPIAEDASCMRNTMVGPCTDGTDVSGTDLMLQTPEPCGYRPGLTGITIACGAASGIPSPACP